MAENDHATYYTGMSPKLMRGFEKISACAAIPMEHALGGKKSAEARKDARKAFADLIPQLPYIGGGKAPGTRNLIGGAQLLAIIQALEKQGLQREAIGEIVYRTCERFFTRVPSFLARCLGRVMGSGFFLAKRKKTALESQKREFSGAFVSEFVVSEDGAFDYGQDVLECAICKLYKQHGAEKYLPYVCLGDYPMFRHFGIGFARTKTLGNGADKCDFRFTRSGKTLDGWPPERLPEWKG